MRLFPWLRETSLLQYRHDLIDLGAEEVQAGEDTAVGTQIVLLHNFFVVDRVSYVDVRIEGDASHSRVQI